MRLIKFGFFFLIIGWLLSSCTSYKNVPYFMDIPDSARLSIINAPYKELTIQPDDILSIYIQTIDPMANAVFAAIISPTQSNSGYNAPSNLPSAGSISQQQAVVGLLVDKDGLVVLPQLGKIHVGGLTTAQARDTIQAKVEVLYKSPTVTVRFANFKVNILGEVLRPGTYVLPNEKNTIYDALSLAGDLTVFGKRENVLLIRDSAGKSNLIRFSLNSKNLIHQDFFYLRQNDVIYVEPNQAKIASLDAVKTRNYAILGAILSVLIIFATRVK